MRGFSSVFSFASSKAPACCSASRSKTGPSMRQGPHHSAQKSTTTGTERERSITSLWNERSSTSKTYAECVVMRVYPSDGRGSDASTSPPESHFAGTTRAARLPSSAYDTAPRTRTCHHAHRRRRAGVFPACRRGRRMCPTRPGSRKAACTFCHKQRGLFRLVPEQRRLHGIGKRPRRGTANNRLY